MAAEAKQMRLIAGIMLLSLQNPVALAEDSGNTKRTSYVSWGQSGALPQEDMLDLPFDELREQRFIIGSADDCVEHLHLYHQHLGANHVLLRVPWAGMPQKQVLEAVTLVGERIIPYPRDVS